MHRSSVQCIWLASNVDSILGPSLEAEKAFIGANIAKEDTNQVPIGHVCKGLWIRMEEIEC
jgi:hypothetical protein